MSYRPNYSPGAHRNNFYIGLPTRDTGKHRITTSPRLEVHRDRSKAPTIRGEIIKAMQNGCTDEKETIVRVMCTIDANYAAQIDRLEEGEMPNEEELSEDQRKYIAYIHEWYPKLSKIVVKTPENSDQNRPKSNANGRAAPSHEEI